MAGMEGGIGGPHQNWKRFWLTMLGLSVIMIGGISIGVYAGWVH